MRSIRTFLQVRLLAGTTVVLAVTGVAAYLVVAHALEQQFDRNLSDRVKGFASILFQTENTLTFEFSDELMPEYEAGERPAYFQIWLADGSLVERSNSLGEADLELADEPDLSPAHWTAALPDGRLGRYVAQRLEVHHVFPEEGPDRPQAAEVVVVVARGREGLVAAERAVLASTAAAAALLIGLMTFLAWRSVQRGLEPMNRLAAALDAVHVHQLPERFDVGQLPVELQPVTATIEALLRRVDSALSRERRTTADIAHELRTPISEVLTTSEVALRNGRDPAGAERALGTVREVAWRMGRSVSTLLKLARLEMGAETFGQEEVDLGTIVAEHLRAQAAIERERELRIACSIEPGERVLGDSDVLGIVVSNLLSNAFHYSPEHGTVGCRLERSGDGWCLVVENPAGDLGPEDLSTLSEPFWRKDGARTDRDRSGLGLALSQALAQRTGLELSFAIEDGTFAARLAGNRAGRGGRPAGDAPVTDEGAT